MSVIFDQLRVSDDGKRLFIDLHVNEATYFNDYYLKSLTVTTAEYVPESVSGIPEDYIYKKTYPDTEEGRVKEDHLLLNVGDLAYGTVQAPNTFSGPLLFVFAEIQILGSVDPCTPCGLDGDYAVAVTFDTNLLYQRVMDYTKQFGDECTIPTGFTDYILLWNAFKASVETEHYIPAIKYYNMLFGIPHESPTRDGSHSPFGGIGVTSKIIKPCNCNG